MFRTCRLLLVDAGGTVLVRTKLDSLAAPTNFVAKTAKVRLPASPHAAAVALDPNNQLPEKPTTVPCYRERDSERPTEEDLP